MSTSSAATFTTVNRAWTAEPGRAPRTFTAESARMVIPASTGTVQGAARAGSRPLSSSSSSAKNVARAPMAAGVATSR